MYGPYGRPDMAYFSFANNIVKGKPIKIFTGEGGSELARDFTYVGDVVKAGTGADYAIYCTSSEACGLFMPSTVRRLRRVDSRDEGLNSL